MLCEYQMATVSELNDLMKEMGVVDEDEKPKRHQKRESRSRGRKSSRSDKGDASHSSKSDKGKSHSKGRSRQRNRRALTSDPEEDEDKDEHGSARRSRRKHSSSRSSKSKTTSKRSQRSRKARSPSPESENEFDRPDPLPEDPNLAPKQVVADIRAHIFKLLRNQTDEEPYTFRELRSQVSKERQQQFESKLWRKWFRSNVTEINQIIEDEGSDWDKEDSEEMPVAKTNWGSNHGASPSHTFDSRYAHGQTNNSDRKGDRFADSDEINENKLKNLLGGTGKSGDTGESFAERLKRETQSIAKAKGGAGRVFTSKFRSTRTPGERTAVLGLGLHIGGSKVRNACRELQCLKCDFEVVCFVGHRWHESVNYIFFRNYVPNESKLRAKLERDRFMCAYACQCTWQSVRQAKALQGSRIRAKPEGGAGSGGDVTWVERT